MKIGLIDVDGHNFPNHALMRISAYHKAQGDTVEWANPLFADYDRVYKSKIFTFSPDEKYDYGCEVIKGGTGYDIKTFFAGLTYLSLQEKGNPMYFIRNGKVDQLYIRKPMRGNTILG